MDEAAAVIQLLRDRLSNHVITGCYTEGKDDTYSGSHVPIFKCVEIFRHFASVLEHAVEYPNDDECIEVKQRALPNESSMDSDSYDSSDHSYTEHPCTDHSCTEHSCAEHTCTDHSCTEQSTCTDKCFNLYATNSSMTLYRANKKALVLMSTPIPFYHYDALWESTKSSRVDA